MYSLLLNINLFQPCSYVLNLSIHHNSLWPPSNSYYNFNHKCVSGTCSYLLSKQFHNMQILFNSGSHDDVSKELKSINEARIRKEYCSLTKKIIRTLQKVDIKELKLDIANIFDPEDVSDDIISSSDVYEIFRQLTTKHFWSFSDINKLTALADLHIEDDCEIEKAIEKYNDNLIGYKTCTLIGEKIKFDSMQQESDEELEHEKDEVTEEKDPSYYNITTRKKLVVSILKKEGCGHIKVSEKSLLYLEEIFQKMKGKFNLKLDAVLKKVATGSIEIAWYIPSISAWIILDKLPENLQFLQEEGISTMFLEDVLIFSDSIGVINSKVNKYHSEL